jgi:hypothetical protein
MLEAIENVTSELRVIDSNMYTINRTTGDLNGNRIVNFEDFAIRAANWLTEFTLKDFILVSDCFDNFRS